MIVETRGRQPDQTTALESVPAIDGSLRFYPNPAVEFTTFQLSGQVSDEGELLLFDSKGSLLQRRFIRGREQQIDLSNLAPGVYHLLIWILDKPFMGSIVKIR